MFESVLSDTRVTQLDPKSPQQVAPFLIWWPISSDVLPELTGPRKPSWVVGEIRQTG
jgi:hypothetical protein